MKLIIIMWILNMMNINHHVVHHVNHEDDDHDVDHDVEHNDDVGQLQCCCSVCGWVGASGRYEASSNAQEDFHLSRKHACETYVTCVKTL